MKNNLPIALIAVFQRLFITLLLCFFSSSIFAQISLNMELQSNWDDNSIGVISGVVFNDIWGYVDPDDSREYAIMGSTEYTHFIDITDPENPVEVERIAGNSGSLWRDFKTYSHYAYGVADQGAATFQIFDLSDLPNSVTKVYDGTAFFTRSHNIFIDEANARLYVVGASNADVIILDLSLTPSNPTLLKNIDLGQGYIHDIYVRNHVAYCSHIYTKNLFVYDFSDVDNPLILGSLTSYSNKGLNHSNWVSEDGNTLVLADETHDKALKVVDVSDLDDIKEITTFKSTLLAPTYTNSIPHNPFIYGNQYAFVSYYHDGVQVYDISDPANPFRAAYYDTNTAHTGYGGYKGCWGVYPFLPSGNIIASDVSNGLYVLQTTFPLQNCEEEANISGTYEDDWVFEANFSIASDATIMLGGNMTFRAANKVELNPGFESENGSVLKTDLTDNCNDAINDNTVEEEEDESATKTRGENDVFQVQSYPNPFQTRALIEYVIPKEGINVRLEIYNSNGQKVQTLVKTNHHKSGKFKMIVDGENFSLGVYYCVFRADDYLITKKMVKYE